MSIKFIAFHLSNNKNGEVIPKEDVFVVTSAPVLIVCTCCIKRSQQSLNSDFLDFKALAAPELEKLGAIEALENVGDVDL